MGIGVGGWCPGLGFGFELAAHRSNALCLGRVGGAHVRRELGEGVRVLGAAQRHGAAVADLVGVGVRVRVKGEW